VFIDQITNADAMPVLERMAQFAARRQDLLAHNIANLSTPNFIPQDVSTEDFQESLKDAVDQRRDATGGVRGDLPLAGTREVDIHRDGRLTLNPSTPGDNILFHDRNNRDLERMMQDLVENITAFRVAGDILRNRIALMQSAIAERV
jgi:flagellar basal-body rod protein FlgB